ncbi:MAG TPA: RNA polymerase sigma factor [Thermomicrobiaceae bacterium]|nr:RNA polymerase sigma factor [Thermomicrobiaceae bacterium]
MPRERARLVRLCARLTGDAQAAEDLAQETLLAGWRDAHTLRDPSRRAQWLGGIARNLCLRWLRARGRELARLAPAGESGGIAGECDLEEELERDELARLLDRALGLLPPETRGVLAARYLEEASHAEIAQRLGLSEDAVAMRLTRGRRGLRRALTGELSAEAAAFGFSAPVSGDWQETRIWCPGCGTARLLVHLPPAPGTIAFRCPACHPEPERTGWEYRLANATFARLLGDLRRPRTILNRAGGWVHDYYRQALADHDVACPNCGRPARLQRYRPGEFPLHAGGSHGVFVACQACGECVTSSSGGLVTALPEVRAFWREHRRIRTLPGRIVEAGGAAVVVTSFEAVTGAARLDVLSLRDSLQVAGIYDGAGRRIDGACSRS